MAVRLFTKRRIGIMAGAALLSTLALPAVTAGAAKKITPNPFTCLAPAQLNTITKGTYGTPTKGAGFVPAAGVCTYKNSSGASFLIAHAPLLGTKLKKDAQLAAGHDHLTSVSGYGKAAIRGTGKDDILFVQQGKNVYEFLDNSGASSLAQLEAVAKLVVPA